jgi:hypothetical protein
LRLAGDGAARHHVAEGAAGGGWSGVIYFAETLQLSVECLARLAPRRFLLCGWMLVPRGAPPVLRVLAGDRALVPSRQLAPPRPDVPLLQPEIAQVQGFLLLLEDVPEGAPLTLTVAAGGVSGRINLLDAGIDRDLRRALARQPDALCFALLQAARDDPAHWPLLTQGYREHGAFGAWLEAPPQVASAAPQPAGLLAAAASAATEGGEVMLGLRLPGRPQRGLEVEPVVLARLTALDGGADEIVFVALEDSHLSRVGAAACWQARLPEALLPRLVAVELVAEIRLDEERLWLRARPPVGPVPAFLDAVAALPGPEAEGDVVAGLLQPLLARREARLLPGLAAVAGSAPAPAAGPRLAVITGCDEPALLPLLEILAARLEQRCDRLLLVGPLAEAAVQVFARRGRLPAGAARLAGPALAGAMALDAAVVLLEPQDLGRAVIGEALDALFAAPLQGAELARLQALQAAAGCGTGPTDSLVRLRQPRDAPWRPPVQAWCRPLAGALIEAHLRRLWARAVPAEAAA